MNEYLILIGVLMIITGFVIVYLGKKREVPNAILWSLFPIFHGLHEFFDFFESNQAPFILERFGIFFAISSSFFLLAATIEFNGAITQPIGKLIALIGIIIASFFIFILPENLIEYTLHHEFDFGLLQISILRFFHGFFMTILSILSVLLSFFYLKWKSNRDFITIDPKISYLTVFSIILLSFYAFFEGFNFKNELFTIFRAVSMSMFIIIPLFFVIQMSSASYFSNLEKLRLERKIIKSEENFREMLETSSMGLLEIDIKSQDISYVNPKFLEIIGYSLKELKRKDFMYESVIHPKDRQQLFKNSKEYESVIHPKDRQQLFKNSKEKNLEFRIYDNEGRIKWLKGKWVNQINEKGKLIKMRLWVDDITKKKKQDKRLSEINKVKSELLIRTSHELKTPLISIKGYVELLLSLYSEKFDKDIILNLNLIKKGSMRLEKIVNNFFKASDLESNQLELNVSEKNISSLIKESVENIKNLALSRNLSLSLNIQENLISKLEEEEIHDVLNNLLLNAINNTPKHGEININSEIKNSFVIISIQDNGVGILEEEKKNIFKQFGKVERYGQGRDLGIDGIGLGLYISKKIVELHGGNMWVESEGRDKGSTFYFSLPLKK